MTLTDEQVRELKLLAENAQREWEAQPAVIRRMAEPKVFHALRLVEKIKAL